MSKVHEQLKERAIEAIDELFGDATVPQSQTRSTLEELIEHIRVSIEALEDVTDEVAGDDGTDHAC